MRDTMDLLANISFQDPTWDLFIIIFFIVAAFIYGLSLGRDRVLVILVSIYMALGVVTYAPFLNEPSSTIDIGIDRFFVLKITAFIGAFLLLFFILSRSALMKTIASNDEVGSWWQVIIFSILHVGLLVSVVMSFLPSSAHVYLAPLTQKIFISEIPRFLWVLGPIVAMALIPKPPADDGGKE